MTSRIPPFLRFAIIGTIAFAFDLAVLRFALNVLGFDLYSAKILCFLVVVTFTWAMNRTFTFPERRAHGAGPIMKEWAHFVAANSIGLTVNYAVYVMLVTFASGFPSNPYFASGCGAIAGMFLNFVMASRLVFREES